MSHGRVAADGDAGAGQRLADDVGRVAIEGGGELAGEVDHGAAGRGR